MRVGPNPVQRAIGAVIVAALLAGCGVGGGTSASSPSAPSPTVASVTTGTPAAKAATPGSAKSPPSGGASATKTATTPARDGSPPAGPATGTPGNDPRLTDRQTGRVVDVIDGDTFRIRVGSETETVRVLGINTPEVSGPHRDAQCFGQEASARAKELLTGQTVTVAADPTQDTYDRFDRRLAHVWLSDGRLFAEVMTSEGYAGEYTTDRDNPHLYRDRLRSAQNAARQNQRGLWSRTTCDGRFDATPASQR